MHGQKKTEYVIDDRMTRLLNHFTSLTDVRIAIFSLDGEEICAGKNRSISDFCSMRRKEKEFNEACKADDQRGRDLALKNRGLYFYQCHSGLCEAAMPIEVGEVHFGYAMIGQFRLVNSSLDVQDQRELQAVEKIPEFTRDKIDNLLGIFEVLVSYISNHALIGRRELDLLNPLLERVCSDPAEALSLAEAASLVELSASRFCHLFSSRVGISFKRYQMKQRLKLADRLIKSNPSWQISRIAKACGFEDPLYFSRVYKKHRGISPSKANNFIVLR